MVNSQEIGGIIRESRENRQTRERREKESAQKRGAKKPRAKINDRKRPPHLFSRSLGKAN